MPQAMHEILEEYPDFDDLLATLCRGAKARQALDAFAAAVKRLRLYCSSMARTRRRTLFSELVGAARGTLRWPTWMLAPPASEPSGVLGAAPSGTSLRAHLASSADLSPASGRTPTRRSSFILDMAEHGSVGSPGASVSHHASHHAAGDGAASELSGGAAFGERYPMAVVLMAIEKVAPAWWAKATSAATTLQRAFRGSRVRALMRTLRETAIAEQCSMHDVYRRVPLAPRPPLASSSSQRAVSATPPHKPQLPRHRLAAARGARARARGCGLPSTDCAHTTDPPPPPPPLAGGCSGRSG